MRKYFIIIFVIAIFSKPVFAAESCIFSGVLAIEEEKEFFEEIIRDIKRDSVYLKEMQEDDVTSKIEKIDDVNIKGMTYKNAIVCSEDTTITYSLYKKYKCFTSYVSVCDDVPPLLVDENINGVNLKMRKPLGRVQFSVFVDDVLMYFSSVMNSDSLPEYVDINVENKEKLVIVIKNMDENYVKASLLESTLYQNNILHKPQNIEYKREDGTFLYCNNPESIKYKDTLNNNKIIYEEKNVIGKNCLFAEQNNSTGDDMYYAVLLKNNTNDEAIVNIYNKGLSLNGWTGLNENENCWRNFSNDIHDTLTVLPNQAVWLLEPIKVSQYNQYTGSGVVNLAIKFSTDTCLDLKIVAFNENFDINSPNDINGEYEGFITDHTYLWGEARNYKGKTSNYPKQECTLEWEIDDNTKTGYLPVSYNNINRAGFITHITKNKHTSALEKDMYEFFEPNKLCFCYNNQDYSTMIANLGNWAITYKETIKIKNRGNKARSVDIILRNAFLNSGVILISKNGDVIKSYNQDMQVVKTLDLAPNETTSCVLEYILPACSVGGLAHYIKLI